MQITLAEPSHLDFIVRAQLAMAEETERLALDPDTVKQGVSAIFEGRARGFYVVALDEGSPVACALVLDEWSDWRNGTVWWLHSVYVAPEVRRQGTFRSIFAFLEARARAGQIRGLRLYVDRSNERAKAVYRSLGMDDQHYELFEKML